MKRFYREVAVIAADDGYGVTLDGRRLKTPAKRGLAVPTEALAVALAVEWEAQEAEIRPDTMKLTKLVSTALDRVADHRATVVAETAHYGNSDLLCYRAEAPSDLVAREAMQWQPLLDWASLRFDAPLLVTSGIVPITQPAASLKALHAALDGLDILNLTAAADLTAAAGSLVLALAAWDRRLDGSAVCEAVFVDEIFQAERWGDDAEALARRRAVELDILAAVHLIELLRT